LLLNLLCRPECGSKTPYIDCSFFRYMISRKAILRMSDLSATLALIFIARNNMDDILDASRPETLMILDLGLRSENATLKLAALGCLESKSLTLYSPSHLSLIYRDLFERTQHASLETEDRDLKWSIFINMLRGNLMKMSIHSKCAIIDAVRRTFAEELLEGKKSKSTDHNLIYNCIQVGLEYCRQLLFEKVHPYIYRCLVDIASFYPRLPQEFMEDMLPFVSEVLQLEYHWEGSISPKTTNLLGLLLSQYEWTSELRFLGIFEQYIAIFHKKWSLGLSLSIFPMFTFLMDSVRMKARKRSKEEGILLYGELVLLNLYVLYFGHEMNSN
jgi:hypothetical protein